MLLILSCLSIFIHSNINPHTFLSYRTGHVSNAVKHLYVGRMAGLKTEEHIREMGCKFDPPEKEMVWLDDSPTKAWVLGSLQQHNVA